MSGVARTCICSYVKALRGTAKFCFRCGNKLHVPGSDEQKSMQQRPKCVFCQRELETGQPFCDECGADQKMGELLKSSEHDT